MAQKAGSTDTSVIITRAEDVRDVIYDEAVEDTPFLRVINDGFAPKNIRHSWHTDTLRAPAANVKAEGNVYAFAAADQPVLVGNELQISDETVSITGTTEAVKMYGRNKKRGGELARVSRKKAKELMRDIEYSCVGIDQASDPTANARKSGSYSTWIESNSSRGATGADGGYSQGTSRTVAPTAGTNRVFAESMVKDVNQSIYTNTGGMSERVAMMPPSLKRAFSAFDGLSQTRVTLPVGGKTRRQATVLGAADVYIDDFGPIVALPNVFMKATDVNIINPSYWEIAYLRKLERNKLAKTADTEDWAMVCEWTLVSKNEVASGVIADVTAS